MNTLANGNMCKRRKVFSFNSELYKVTGVQKVLMDIHHAVKEDYDFYQPCHRIQSPQ